MDGAGLQPLQVFISYAHEDEDLCREFLTHLSPLQREGLIRDWHDRRITGGSEWAGQIDEHLNSADIIVLLVSADFLASEYCYGVEMKRALERHEAGAACVVPVILRPADWQLSPLAELNALPTDGKPVVDWKTHDHGFLNVVEGLRQVALELRQPAPVADIGGHRGAAAHRWIPKVRPWHAVVAAVSIVLLLAAGWFWRASSRRKLQAQELVSQGDKLLDVGRYEQAGDSYRQALSLNAGNRAAGLGLKISGLAAIKPDAVLFEQKLNQLLKEDPKDAHLKVLEGDDLVGHGKLDEAMKQYDEAARLNPNLAEAYFRMGALYDSRHNMTRAVEMYERAVKLAPSSPQYACNLADQYFKHGEYQEAIAEYGNIRQFPLATLEMAKIYRLLGRLTEARFEEGLAIEWLDLPAVANMPENQLPWWLDFGGPQPVALQTHPEKLCYAHLELSATYYLAGDALRAKDQSDRAANDCGAHLSGVQGVVAWELQRVSGERAELSKPAKEFRRKFLAE